MSEWPLCRPGQVHVKNPKHPAAILTCWTRKDLTIKELDDAGIDYNSVGQFYTTRGFSPLIRNLLANPHIKYIVLVGNDLSGAGDKLFDLWYYKIEEGFPGCEDIPLELQIELKYNIGLFLPSPESFQEVMRGTLTEKSEVAKREIHEYPEPESNITSFPSADFGHCVSGRTIPETYLKMLQYILRFGVETNTHYEDPQKEVLAMQNVITAEPLLWSYTEDKLFNDIPEWMPESTEHLSTYIEERMLSGKHYPELKYTYGELIHANPGAYTDWIKTNQFEEAVDKMVEDSDQRSCVISLWDPIKHTKQKSGTPCLNHLQFRMRNNSLTMHAFIRSNDMYAGWPENAYALRVLQEHFLQRYILKRYKNGGTDKELTLINLGPLCITSMSAHLYKDTWEPAQELVDKYLEVVSLNPWEDYDLKGQFNVIHEDKKIIVELTKDDNILQRWEGKNSRVLCNQIVRDIGTDNVSNAMWLARELKRGEERSLNCSGDQIKTGTPDAQCDSCVSFDRCWGFDR